MNPVHFKPTPGNRYFVIEAPPSYDHESNGECIGLPVEIVEHKWFRSCWKPTPEQLALLNAGGAVEMHQYGGQNITALNAVGPDGLLVEA